MNGSLPQLNYIPCTQGSNPINKHAHRTSKLINAHNQANFRHLNLHDTSMEPFMHSICHGMFQTIEFSKFLYYRRRL